MNHTQTHTHSNAQHDYAMAPGRITGHFQGIWVPLVTPFHDGEIDLEAAQRLAVDMVAGGVHGLVVCGTTGEAAMLGEREQTMLLDAVLQAVGPNVPVVMGIGGSDTRAVCASVRRYNDHPLAGLLISAPAYVRPSQLGMLLHFQALSRATDHSIVLYNVPARTGVNLEPATVAELSRDTRFVAIKEASGNLLQITDLLLNTRLDVLSGEDTLLLDTLRLGGHGAMSAAAHIRPDLYVQLYKLVKDGQLPAAQALFKCLLPVIRLLFAEPNPAPVKAALAMQGKISDELRLPMTAMTPAGKKRLAAALQELDALPLWRAPLEEKCPQQGALLQLVTSAIIVPARHDDHHHH